MRRWSAPSLLPMLWLAGTTAQSATPPPSCAPEVIGTWKLESSALTDTTLLRFTRDGWVSVLSGPSDQPASRYETIAQVSYSLLTRDAQRLRFQTLRGNDVFAGGESFWEITAHTDQSLTTHAAEAAHGELLQWSRVTTQRYFLTLAAYRGTSQQPAMTFAAWTTLGSGLQIEALGSVGEGPSAHVAQIRRAQIEALARRAQSTQTTMLRIELGEADYIRTHRVFEAWQGVLKNDQLARTEPQAQLNELLDATVQSLNRCMVRLQVPTDTDVAHRAPFAWIQELRRRNERRHVSDQTFPIGWRPGGVG